MTQELLNTMQSDPAKWAGLALCLYEFFVRLRPTKKNLSILAVLITIINTVFPNRKKCDNGLKENHKY